MFPGIVSPTMRTGVFEPPPVMIWDDFVGSPSIVLESASLPALWNVVPQPSGGGTVLLDLNDEVGGAIQLRPAPIAASTVAISANREHFIFERGRRLSAVCRFRIRAASGTSAPFEWFFGLSQIPSSDPFDSVPAGLVGLYGRTNPRKNLMDMEVLVTKTGGASGFLAVAGEKYTSGDYQEVCVDYDGQNTVTFSLDGRLLRKYQGDGIPFGVIVGPNLAVETVDGAQHFLEIDYIGVRMDRTAD